METIISMILASLAIIGVGGLKTIPSATAAWVDVEFSGSAWVLTGYGAL